MIRHSQNTNLSLHYEDSYQGYPVQLQHGPLVLEYLHVLNQTIQRGLNEYPRVFAFRVDLRLPSGLDADHYLESNVLIERFFESFKAKTRHNRMMAKRAYGTAHDTTVRFVWAREIGWCGRPHYHLVILLNNDAFHSLGDFESGRDNVFNRLLKAWASALGLHFNAVDGLVHVPDNACYLLRRDDPASIAELFYRASYLCKAASKSYGNGCHGFGASRI